MLLDDSEKESLKIWYKKDRENINYLFSEMMIYMDNRQIPLIVSKQVFYDKFIEFLYINKYLKK